MQQCKCTGAPVPSCLIEASAKRSHAFNLQDCGIYRYDLHFPKRWGSMELASEWTGGEDPLARPEMDIIDRISLNTPVNHASVSPDGRSMVAVGDTNEVFVFALSSTGHVTLIDTIEGERHIDSSVHVSY